MTDPGTRDLTLKRRYRRDIRLLHKRGHDLEKLIVVVEAIRTTGQAPASCRPHRLSGDWCDYWECHIAPDWLLIYTVSEETVTLYRTGTHADLF